LRAKGLTRPQKPSFASAGLADEDAVGGVFEGVLWDAPAGCWPIAGIPTADARRSTAKLLENWVEIATLCIVKLVALVFGSTQAMMTSEVSWSIGSHGEVAMGMPNANPRQDLNLSCSYCLI
jgi:hypothetical protein